MKVSQLFDIRWKRDRPDSVAISVRKGGASPILVGRLSCMREFEAEQSCAVSMRCGLCVELSPLRKCAHAPVPVSSSSREVHGGKAHGARNPDGLLVEVNGRTASFASSMSSRGVAHNIWYIWYIDKLLITDARFVSLV